LKNLNEFLGRGLGAKKTDLRKTGLKRRLPVWTAQRV
jgi:hypothetical protein